MNSSFQAAILNRSSIRFITSFLHQANEFSEFAQAHSGFAQRRNNQHHNRTLHCLATLKSWSWTLKIKRRPLP